jgi:hypothetical protein
MSTNVVSLPKQYSIFTRSLSIKQLLGHEGVKLLATEIRFWHLSDTKNNTLKSLAHKANLSPTTVSKIMDETTRFPRKDTMLMILVGMDYTMVKFER